jgi:hypothetical protein
MSYLSLVHLTTTNHPLTALSIHDDAVPPVYDLRQIPAAKTCPRNMLILSCFMIPMSHFTPSRCCTSACRLTVAWRWWKNWPQSGTTTATPGRCWRCAARTLFQQPCTRCCKCVRLLECGAYTILKMHFFTALTHASPQ